MDNSLENFIETEDFLYNLSDGDSTRNDNDDFAEYIYSQAEEKSEIEVESNYWELPGSNSTAVKEMKEKLNTAVANDFFKMLFDSYMADSESDLRFRLGEKTSEVIESKSVNTGVSYKTQIDIDSKLSKISIPPKNIVSLSFPPFKQITLKEEESEKNYRKFNDTKGQWEYCDESEATESFDAKSLLLSSKNFTYRGNSFKSLNDNIILIQRMLEHTTGIVSTYLTEWDISIYLQEGMISNSDASETEKSQIGLLYRILTDSPAGNGDTSSSLTYGLLNAAISKLSTQCGIVNPPKMIYKPENCFYSRNWTEYDSFNRGDGLDIFYDIANLDFDNKILLSCKFNLNELEQEKTYDDSSFRAKLYYWDARNAAYSGWYNWRDIKYYQAIYTTPEDGLSDLDIIHQSDKGSYVWGNQSDITNKALMPRIIQTLYNNDETLGFTLGEWKERVPIEGNEEISYYYDFYIKGKNSGGPVFVARAAYDSNNILKKYTDKAGNEIESIDEDNINKYFREWAPFLKVKESMKYLLTKTCPHWPEVSPTYGSRCPTNRELSQNEEIIDFESEIELQTKSEGTSANLNLGSISDSEYVADCTTSGIPRMNPLFYGGPHGKDLSPVVIQSLFDENSKVLRNVPRISPNFSSDDNNTGVEKYYGYNLQKTDFGDLFPNLGNPRSPTSCLNFLRDGFVSTSKRKVERWVEYKEVLPFKKYWWVENCKKHTGYKPIYEKLGDAYNKKGKDTVQYGTEEVQNLDVIEHTGFFSPSENPTKDNFKSYKTFNGGSWYETMAYEWENYYQYATNDMTYFKGNERYATYNYPYTEKITTGSAYVYGATASNAKPNVYGNASSGNSSVSNWQYKTDTTTFYELMVTYKSMGKIGTWHRWEVYYVDTPSMYASYNDYWQIDEIETSEYDTTETKGSKTKRILLGIFTLGISTLFTQRQVNANKTNTSKKFRLVIGAQKDSDKIESNDGSYQILSKEEKEFKIQLFGEDDKLSKEWKKCYLFVSDSENEARNKGPYAIFGLWVRKSTYSYVVTEKSTNKVGCKSKTTTVDKIEKSEIIEVWNGSTTDTDYEKYKPEIWSAFNKEYISNLFDMKGISFDIENIKNFCPTDANTEQFINDIFAARQNIDVRNMNSISKPLYLLGQSEEDRANAAAAEIGTYGYGFTTYWPGVEPKDIDSFANGFKSKLNITEKSKIARDNLKIWSIDYRTNELKKEKLYEKVREYTESLPEGSEETPRTFVVYKKLNPDALGKVYIENSEKEVVKNSSEESTISSALRYSDSFISTEAQRFGQEKWDNYKLANDKPLNELFNIFGDEFGGEKSSRYFNTFTAPFDFWNSTSLDGSSFEKPNGYSEFSNKFSNAIKGYYTTSTFFKENLNPGEIGDIMSPCLVANEIPFLLIYSCLITQCAWTKKAKDLIGSIAFADNFRSSMKKVINSKVQAACGIDGEINSVKAEEGQRNSTYYNPWIVNAYNNATSSNKSDFENSMDSIVLKLEELADALTKSTNLDSGYGNWSLNQIENIYSKTKEIEDFTKDKVFEKIFNYIYSYLNVLYEYRKYFIFKRCNKQNGTLFVTRCLESAAPLAQNEVDNNTAQEIAAQPENAGDYHKYNVSFYATTNSVVDVTKAILDENSQLPPNQISKVYIKVEYVENDSDKLKDFIEYFNSESYTEDSNIQKYFYLVDKGRFGKIPFNDTYILKSDEWTKTNRKIAINNSLIKNNPNSTGLVSVDNYFLKLDENKNPIVPFEINSYTQNIIWFGDLYVDTLGNLDSSFIGTELENKKIFYYKAEENGNDSNYPKISMGVTDGVDPEAISKVAESEDLVTEAVCMARTISDFWEVTLNSRPYQVHYENNVYIETFSENTEDDFEYKAGTAAQFSGPFSQILWPIYSEQNAPIPSTSSLFNLNGYESV